MTILMLQLSYVFIRMWWNHTIVMVSSGKQNIRILFVFDDIMNRRVSLKKNWIQKYKTIKNMKIINYLIMHSNCSLFSEQP